MSKIRELEGNLEKSKSTIKKVAEGIMCIGAGFMISGCANVLHGKKITPDMENNPIIAQAQNDYLVNKNEGYSSGKEYFNKSCLAIEDGKLVLYNFSEDKEGSLRVIENKVPISGLNKHYSPLGFDLGGYELKEFLSENVDENGRLSVSKLNDAGYNPKELFNNAKEIANYNLGVGGNGNRGSTGSNNGSSGSDSSGSSGSDSGTGNNGL